MFFVFKITMENTTGIFVYNKVYCSFKEEYMHEAKQSLFTFIPLTTVHFFVNILYNFEEKNR